VSSRQPFNQRLKHALASEIGREDLAGLNLQERFNRHDELDEAIEAWTAAFHAELSTDRAPTYVNFMGDEGADAVRDAYPAFSYGRLRELKRRYDPDNVFRSNHNILPA